MYAALRNFAFVLLAALLAACNPVAQIEDGGAAVAKFHQQMNAADYETIYADLSKEFRDSDSKENIVAFFTRVHEAAGKVKSTERDGFNLKTNNGVTVVKIMQTTEYERFTATEEFEFVRRDGRLQLVNYKIEQLEPDKE